MFKIGEILDLAIRIEKNGEATYRKALLLTSDLEVAAMLEWMAAEEARHGQWFGQLKADLDQGLRNPFLEEMGRQVFEDLVGGQTFSLKEVDFAGVTAVDELFSIFLEFEQDTVLFYEMIAPFIEEGETRRQLKLIIDEENRHIAQLAEKCKKGTEAAVLLR